MSTDPMQQFGKEGMDLAMTAFNVWAKNAQAIATEVADYSKKPFEGSTAAFQKLINAKSVEKAMEVQTEYLRWSCEDLVAEASCMREWPKRLSSRSKARCGGRPWAGENAEDVDCQKDLDCQRYLDCQRTSAPWTLATANCGGHKELRRDGSAGGKV